MTFSLFAAASLLAAAAGAPACAAPLAAERWSKRVVLVFAADTPDGERQMRALLADREALAERDMLLLAVSGETVSARFGSAASVPEAASLRAAFGIKPDKSFTVVLVGKDGGEKLRRTEPVEAGAIFGLIDSMPMRQSEAGG